MKLYDRIMITRLIGILLLALTSSVERRAHSSESEWITTGTTGRLIYVPDAEGDRILDFSDVGYRGSGTALVPDNVPTQITLSPIAGDNTAHIQAAIDQVSALPIGADGYRGAVLLQAGSYNIDSQLEIRASGVVLRGVGREAGDSVLNARNPLTGGSNPNQRPLIRVYGNGSRSNIGSTRNMIDKVVPAGSHSFRVDSTSGFSIGDTVRIERPSTQAWIDAVGMDNPPNGDPPWTPGSMNVRYDRVITRIEGNRIFVDAPLANSFDQQFGGGTIREYVWSGAIENIGIENLRGEAEHDFSTDEDHAWEFISIGSSQNSDRAQNVWVRNIAGEHFGDSIVVANPGSKWVTVDDAISENPISQITGSRRYTYDLSGELGLVTNAQADQGRHDFVNNSTRPAGPNVFHNSIATDARNDTGPHQRWATGTLFDNITVEGNAINARNRGSFGTSHGWSGANMVVWNSTADSYRIQNPPTAQNWLIGSTGTIVEDTTFGPQPSGNYDSHGSAVTVGGTTSLYEAQANDARDINTFRSLPGTNNWNEALSWDKSVAPIDSYTVSLRDYLIGDIDEFANDGGGSVDEAFIDPAWEAEINSSSSHPVTGFDDLTDNRNVAFTIQHVLDSGERVVHGSLALALKQAGGLVDTDFIRLFDMSPENRQNFSQLGWDTQINATDTFVGVLDLGGSLEHLQSGSVNVQINDDTGVDWAIYTVTVATPRGDSSSNSVFIEAGSTVVVDSSVGPIADLNFDAAGALELELGGTGLNEFGSVDVLGTANLDGELVVSLSGGFEPSAGDLFEVLTAGSLSGAFDSLTLPALSGGLAWLVNDQATSLALGVTFSADFNGDGTVDATDLLTLQTNYGSSGTTQSAGDADGDGDVDGHDLLAWQQQNGSSVSFLQAVQIPEPTAVFLTLTASSFMLICRISRQD